MKVFLTIVALTAAAAVPASAITVDGTRDAEYGEPIVVQTVQTQFGDAGPPSFSGSELDAAYGRIDGGRLFLLLTGNLESNFNKLEVFIDSRPGGENTLSGTPDYDFNLGSGWSSSNLAGLTFDNIAGSGDGAMFEADYHLLSRWGGAASPFEVDFVDRQGGVGATVPGSHGAGSNTVGLVSAGSILAGAVGPNASGPALSQGLDFAINGNNAAGVTGGTAAADPSAAAAVSTGMEFSIALADLGDPGVGETIHISAMINNGDHNFLSNQILAGLAPPQGNLGGDGAGGFTGNLGGVNFKQFPGVQYFSITVPEPAGLALLSLGGLLMARRRKA